MADIIEMPKLSDTMTVGTLVKWLKKEGDTVANGDMLAEVETDKATMELECFFDGTLLKIFAEAGAQVEIGAPLCAIGEKGEKVEAPAKKSPVAAGENEAAKPAAGAPAAAAAPAPAAASIAPTPVTPTAPSAPVVPAIAATVPTPAGTGTNAPAGRVKISPLAKKLAAEKGIDPSRVKGSGPGGRIVRADILAALENPALLSPAAGAASGGKAAGGSGRPAKPTWAWRSALDKSAIQAPGTAPLSNMRATIAKRLVESKTQFPHFYLEIEVDAAPLGALREQLNAGLGNDGVRLSVNDLILKASALALRAVPQVNSSWSDAGIVSHGATHVSFAVAIDDGLITPVIKDTDRKSVFEISAEAKDLAKRAKSKKLAPAEFTGGTFCVSNLGMMGITRFSAIINPPNAAILAVGTTVKKPVVVKDQITIGERMVLTLSCDHRVVDGALAAQFLNAVKAHLETPALLLL
ncbi:dihydrolipoamide acetyltransferase [Cephaloticoccus primus]|uniref:Acetyltransferase component of pyruvate dehydrogenase complex n=1 Tax=Cephaloticoccus primus TaxID=1548207 RepID=A0A139SJD9_9BACT|nr:pyruvate dehydrogenase complex dihydrolipoamide acetyltransferase [Cephaloticoccus primus]KXU34657.1 dihydrolipoamide acetyltransferase [Cephaloticoccus primus]